MKEDSKVEYNVYKEVYRARFGGGLNGMPIWFFAGIGISIITILFLIFYFAFPWDKF